MLCFLVVFIQGQLAKDNNGVGDIKRKVAELRHKFQTYLNNEKYKKKKT